MTSSQIVHVVDKIEKKNNFEEKTLNFVTKKKLILWALCKNPD
jgi:hypothetical protein